MDTALASLPKRALSTGQEIGVKIATPVGVLLGQLLFGWLGDVLGRKRICAYANSSLAPHSSHQIGLCRRHGADDHHGGHLRPGSMRPSYCRERHWRSYLLAVHCELSSPLCLSP